MTRLIAKLRDKLAGWRRLTWFCVGVLATLLAGLAYDVGDYLLFEHHDLSDIAVARSGRLEHHLMDGSWVLEGDGAFKVHTFATSPDDESQSGIWECQGPAKFTWHFYADETVYILDGQVNVSYEGKTYELREGNVAFFPAGSRADWHVPHGVKKSFHLNHPGRLRRALRKLFFSYPA